MVLDALGPEASVPSHSDHGFFPDASYPVRARPPGIPWPLPRLRPPGPFPPTGRPSLALLAEPAPGPSTHFPPFFASPAHARGLRATCSAGGSAAPFSNEVWGVGALPSALGAVKQATAPPAFRPLPQPSLSTRLPHPAHPPGFGSLAAPAGPGQQRRP